MLKSRLIVVLAPIALIGTLVVLSADRLPSASELRATLAASTADSPDPELRTYSDPVYGFSFRHPPEMTVRAFSDPEGYVVLASIANSKREFQLFVMPVPTDLTLTENLIHAAVQHPIRGALEPFTVGDSPAFRFASDDPLIGETLEIIFLDGLGNLYQLTTYPESRDWFDELLETWSIDPGVLFGS